jgi:hypothetical protein
MAECREFGEKGKQAGQRESKSAGRRVSGVKTRERRAKGYGVDRLRTAAERRMAESSEALAKTLMDNALKGKLESVKILMKLAEEEKARKEEKREEDTPGFADLLVGSVVKIGQMWDGYRWRRVAKSRILEEGCAKWEDLVGNHHKDREEDDLEEAA